MERRATRAGAILAVGTVALVAAIVSYAHMRDLAAAAGEGWRAWLDPLSVDGLLIGSSLVLLSGRTRRWLAWLAVAVGLLVSLAANLAAAEPGLVPHLVAGWPAVALALSYETLLTLVRPRTASPRQAGDQVTPAEPAPEPEPVARFTSVPASIPGDPWRDDAEYLAPVGLVEVPAPADGPMHGPEPTDLDRARHLVHQAHLADEQIGRLRLARLLDVSEHRARQLLDEVNDGQPAA